MLHSVLHVACFLILALNMLGYHDIIPRTHNPNNFKLVLWQADQLSSFDPSTLPWKNWNMDDVNNMDSMKFIKELAKYFTYHNNSSIKKSDDIYRYNQSLSPDSSTLQKSTLNSDDVNNVDVKKLLNELVNHFILLNNSMMKKTDEISANIFMFKEQEKIIYNGLPTNIPCTQTQVVDVSNENNSARKVEIPIVNFKKVAEIEFLVEEDIPTIIKFLQYFSEDEIPSVKKYLDYVSKDKLIASEEGHEMIHLRSRGFWRAAILSSLAIMACIAIWVERHYLFKRNTFVESNRCIATHISAIERAMQKAKDLLERRAEKISSKEEDKIIEIIRQKLVTFQNYIQNKIMDEEKVMELNRKSCLHEQNIQYVLQLINTLGSRQEECLKVDNHVKECLEENLEHLKLVILREKVSTFDHDRYISNLSDAIVKIKERCCVEEDPLLKSRLNEQLLSLKKTLNKLLSKDPTQSACRKYPENPACPEIREKPAFERHHTDEDYTSPVSSPDSSTTSQIRFLERCSSHVSTSSTNELQQNPSTKDDEKDTETFALQDELMKSVMGDKWTQKEKGGSPTANVPKSNLRWIGGIWYLDGKQWYPSLKESTSSTLHTELQNHGASSNNSCLQPEHTPAEYFIALPTENNGFST